MIRILKKTTLICLLFSFFSCSNTTAPKTEVKEEFNLEQVKAHIKKANEQYGERFVTNDLSWYQEKYCAQACAMPEKMEAVCGVGNIMNYYYSEGKNKDFKIHITEKEIYGSAESVVEEGFYDIPDGKGGSFDKGKFIAIWKPEGGQWKIYREIWNSNVAAAEHADAGK